MQHADRESTATAHADLPLTPAQRKRIRIVLWALLCIFGLVSLHLIKLQGFPDPRFLENETLHVGKSPISMPRGRIYDREGRILARERRAPSLYAYPQFLTNPHEAAQRMSVRLAIDEDDLVKRITRRASDGNMMEEVPIKRWLTDEELDAVGDLNQWGEGGLRLKFEPARHYPEESLAAHVVGFVNRDQVGTGGIEAVYNEYLHTKPGWQKSRLDGKRKMLNSHTIEYVPPEGGNDLYLTIDKPIQHILERELTAVMERCQASRAMGLIMDPKTGAVIALACLPAFDPNAYWEYPKATHINGAITEVFEPGSAFKIVTAAAAIERGVVTPETLYDCEHGAWNAYGLRRIKDVHKMGTVPFAEAFAESSNVAIIKVARDFIAATSREEFDSWIRRFGFAKRTSMDFSGESVGMYAGPNAWSGFSVISLPMGQEIAVTMPQLARAFSAIANGGYLVEPHLVERVVDRDGNIIKEFQANERPRVMSERTAAIMRDLCYGVVEHGTGNRAAIPEYRAGGKTGTAQIARPKKEGGGYYADRHTAVFAGFAPIADPRLCTVIVVCNPRSAIYYGGYVCGPVFKNVMREALTRLECPEDPMPPGTYKEDPEHTSDADVLVAQGAPDADLETPAMELAQQNADQVVGIGQLPNLVGLTKRQVKDKLAALGVEWDAQGSGWVVVQEPIAGTPIADVPLCRVVFSNTRNALPVAPPAEAKAAANLASHEPPT